MTMQNFGNPEDLLRQFIGGGGQGIPLPGGGRIGSGGGDANQNGVPDAIEDITLRIKRPATTGTFSAPANGAASAPAVGTPTGQSASMQAMGQATADQVRQQRTAQTAQQNLNRPTGENLGNIIRFARTPEGQEALRAVIDRIRLGQQQNPGGQQPPSRLADIFERLLGSAWAR